MADFVMDLLWDLINIRYNAYVWKSEQRGVTIRQYTQFLANKWRLEMNEIHKLILRPCKIDLNPPVTLCY